MVTFDFGDGKGPVPARQHSNGGGWVADSVAMAVEIFVGPKARIVGGEFHGGEFHGGEFHDGVFRGGVFRGGEFRRTPFQLVGVCDWFVVAAAPGKIGVGCECHTAEEWRSNIDTIADEHGVASSERGRVLRAVELAAQLLAERPDLWPDES